MGTSAPATLEHREETRVATLSRARLEAPDAALAQKGSAVIEEVSACGLRLTSDVQLHPDEALVLRVPGDPLPLHARVVWVHEGARKTWIAGCTLLGESISRAKLPLAPDPHPGRAPLPGRKAFRIAGVVGLLALVVYLYVRLAQAIAGNWSAFKPW